MARHSQISSPPDLIRWSMPKFSRQSAGGGAGRAQLPHGLPGLRPAMTKGNERKRFGGETPTDAMNILPWLTATAAPGAPGAHLSAFHRGSRPKESFIARDSAPGFCFLGRGGKVGGPSVERALPAPTCPSPARPSRPGRSARRITPNAAGSGLQIRPRAPHSPARAWNASRPRPNHRMRFGSICN